MKGRAATPAPSPLAAQLLASGRLTGEILARAEQVRARQGRALGQVLVDSGVLDEEQLYETYAAVVGLPVWDGRGRVVDDPPLPVEWCWDNAVLPVRWRERATLVLAAAEDAGLIDLLRRQLPDWDLALYPERELLYRLEEQFAGLLDGAGESGEADDHALRLADVDQLKDLALEGAIVRRVNDMLTTGARLGASDIHLEPARGRVELRYRVDGVLHTRPGPSVDEYPAVASRLKILANLDIAERRLPQDGRFKTRAGGREIDIRVSTMPSQHGEDVALRLLAQKTQKVELDGVGLSDGVKSRLRALLQHAQGMLLVTGPTGAGKTTTLYAGLTELIDGKRKIITVEDPVEYEIEGITQIQINGDIGMTFASALRSILRHDPDVVFVGEIRDTETAEIAVQAALTGHLVLSTLHTNSALGAVPRLINMGVPDYLLAGSLLGVTAQRLVRRLCPACARAVRIEPALAERFGLDPAREVAEAVGCEECGQTGYAGRLPIVEAAPMSDPLRDAILRDSTLEGLRRAAENAGFASMLDDGIARVVAGETTFAEVLRVVG